MNKLHRVALFAGMSVCGMYAQEPPSRVYEPTLRTTREYLATVRRQAEAASSTGGAAGAAAAALASCDEAQEAKAPLHVRLRDGLAQARTSPDVADAHEDYKIALKQYVGRLYEKVKSEIEDDEKGSLGLALLNAAREYPLAYVINGEVDSRTKKAGEELGEIFGPMNSDETVAFSAEVKMLDWEPLKLLALLLQMDAQGCNL